MLSFKSCLVWPKRTQQMGLIWRRIKEIEIWIQLQARLASSNNNLQRAFSVFHQPILTSSLRHSGRALFQLPPVAPLAKCARANRALIGSLETNELERAFSASKPALEALIGRRILCLYLASEASSWFLSQPGLTQAPSWLKGGKDPKKSTVERALFNLSKGLLEFEC